MNIEYDPDKKWELENVPVAETEAVARHENGLKRQQRQQQG
jgi:hypothetical protein